MSLVSRRTIINSAIAALTFSRLSATAEAEHGCCRQCGCAANRCRKVCRLEKAEKKITTTCWGMECEDICLPGPSTPECKHCETVCCKGPDDKKIITQPKKLTWISWRPGCEADPVTKRKLMKKTVTKTVPSFKWVVEDLCKECVARLEPVSVPRGMDIPKPPSGRNFLVVDWVEETPTTLDPA